MTTAIIFHEKNGNTYFDASTPDLKNAAFLYILRNRHKNNWYDEPKLSDLNENKKDWLDNLNTLLALPVDEAIKKTYLIRTSYADRRVRAAEHLYGFVQDREHEKYSLEPLKVAPLKN